MLGGFQGPRTHSLPLICSRTETTTLSEALKGLTRRRPLQLGPPTAAPAPPLWTPSQLAVAKVLHARH